MAHQRKLIRHAVVALLVAANTAAGARVKATRVEPHKKSQLPAISVYTQHEVVDTEASTSSPREYMRETQLEITAWVAHTDANPADDQMDDIAEQIEAAMEANRYVPSGADELVAESMLVSTETQVVEDDGRSEPLVGIIVLTYAIQYRTSPALGTLDDFLRVDAKQTPVGGIEDDTVPAEDLINVRSTP